MGDAKIDIKFRLRGDDLSVHRFAPAALECECRPARLSGRARLHERLEQLQVTVSGPTHLRCDERCGEIGKPGWLATVAQRHARAARWCVVPGVGGDALAVDRVGLRVTRGEIYGFLGLNGAGKSTTRR